MRGAKSFEFHRQDVSFEVCKVVVRQSSSTIRYKKISVNAFVSYNEFTDGNRDPMVNIVEIICIKFG